MMPNSQAGTKPFLKSKTDGPVGQTTLLLGPMKRIYVLQQCAFLGVWFNNQGKMCCRASVQSFLKSVIYIFFPFHGEICIEVEGCAFSNP